MKKITKYIPYVTLVLGFVGALSEGKYAGAVCCGIIVIITLFHIADSIFNNERE